MNQNFDDVEAALSALTSANLASDAGIRSTQLAERYAPWPPAPFVVLPITFASDLNTDTPFIVPNSVTTLLQWRPKLKSGQECLLGGIEFHVLDTNINVTAWPIIQVEKNGVILGGASVTIDTDAAYYTLGSADPYASPLATLQDGDVLTIRLGRSDSSAQPNIQGVTATLFGKTELVA